MYLIFHKVLRNGIKMSKEPPVELEKDLDYIKVSDFDIDHLSTYNVRVNKDLAILSELKPLAERKAIRLEQENQQQGIELSEREINEIAQGMQISELEIQLLELQLGGM